MIVRTLTFSWRNSNRSMKNRKKNKACPVLRTPEIYWSRQTVDSESIAFLSCQLHFKFLWTLFHPSLNWRVLSSPYLTGVWDGPERCPIEGSWAPGGNWQSQWQITVSQIQVISTRIMSENENILKKGHIGTNWKMHVNADIQRKDSKKTTFTKARGPQSCLNLPLASHQFNVQTMGHNRISLFSTHLVSWVVKWDKPWCFTL